MVKAVVGANWGDEGKGKITDMLAQKADIIVRFQGGANAGHTIVNNYGKDTDRVSGYGSVKNAADKSTSESGKSVNRFKKGVSTLLDKTIYIQAQEGAQAQLADYKAENAPKVDGAALEEAKLAVVNAINALTVQEDNGTVTEPSAPAGGSTTDNSSNSSTDNGKAPQTGDNMLARVYACMAAAAAGIGAVIVGIRKKEDICER